MANKWNDNFLQDSDNFMTSLFKIALTKEPRCGLYLIGDTSFNPFTKKVEYWVKVGKTKDASKRFSTYRTSSPCIYYLDWIETRQLSYEKKYHKILSSMSSKIHRNEWFKINESLYFKLFTRGFEILNIFLDSTPRTDYSKKDVEEEYENSICCSPCEALRRIAIMKLEGRLK